MYSTSIPNVAPAQLRAVKPPGMLKTPELHQKWRFIRKTQFCKNRALASTRAQSLRFRALEKDNSENNTKNDKTQRYSPLILSNIKQNSTKIKVSKSILHKIQQMTILRQFWAPKTIPNPLRKSTTNQWKFVIKNESENDVWSVTLPNCTLY